jgi:murein DD-endopeptidase MepM/ murein hydrolase activator NlpD
MPVQKANILAQRPDRLRPVRQAAFGALLLGLPALGVVAAFGVAPGAVVSEQAFTIIREAIPLPVYAVHETAPARFVTQERVLRGDTVASLFERLGVRDPRALEFLRSDRKGGTIFRKLVPGKTLQAETGPDGELLVLRYFLGPDGILEITRTADGFAARDRAVASAPRVFHKSATIRSSLFAATDAAGIPDAVAMQIARVFATDIDFHIDLRKGDRFSVVYEMLYDAGELVAPGRILAAEFVNGGRVHTAVLFSDGEGGEAHYELDGSNRAKAFLRSPVEFSRVSSGFGARFHPIFKNWRAHTGVDFAAPKGTRVLAAADGHVISAGWRNGYGNAVEVKHGGSIVTLYGHLSGFPAGIRTGARVRQGDPIGYVGATGYATGPHLHYEFKVSGMHQDPMRVALPKATPVPPHLRVQFQAAATEASATIALVRSADAARFE